MNIPNREMCGIFHLVHIWALSRPSDIPRWGREYRDSRRANDGNVSVAVEFAVADGKTSRRGSD